MPSRFPGMDPYVESQSWPGFHNSFIVEMQAALVPRLRPQYVAVIEERVYLEHVPEDAGRFIVPDVAVLPRGHELPERVGGGTATMVAPLTVQLPMPARIREAYLEVRERESQDLVAVIEVLSPGNKRAGSTGRKEYLEKRDIVLHSTVHLVEIDLLRGGERLPVVSPIPETDYYVFVSRRQERPKAQVWAFGLRNRLPQIPVPLVDYDESVSLDLQAVFDSVYDRAGYDYSLNYGAPVEPPLSDEDAQWARSLLEAAGQS